MKKEKLTFEQVVQYAEMVGCKHREGESKAKDYTGKFFFSPWQKLIIMPLYEAPKRTLRGREEPEVCWWCIDSYGNLTNVPSRHLRMMNEARGLAIATDGFNRIMKVLNGVETGEDDLLTKKTKKEDN